MVRRRGVLGVVCLLLVAGAVPALAEPAPGSASVDVKVVSGHERWTVPVTVELTLRGDPGRAVHVRYDTADQQTPGPSGYPPATARHDYEPTSGTVVFPARARDGDVMSFAIPVLSDVVSEGTEAFDVVLESDTAALSASRPEAVISDDAPEACHCFISGVKVYGCVPETACSVCCTDPVGVRLTCKQTARLVAMFRQDLG